MSQLSCRKSCPFSLAIKKWFLNSYPRLLSDNFEMRKLDFVHSKSGWSVQDSGLLRKAPDFTFPLPSHVVWKTQMKTNVRFSECFGINIKGIALCHFEQLPSLGDSRNSKQEWWGSKFRALRNWWRLGTPLRSQTERSSNFVFIDLWLGQVIEPPFI